MHLSPTSTNGSSLGKKKKTVDTNSMEYHLRLLDEENNRRLKAAAKETLEKSAPQSLDPNFPERIPGYAPPLNIQALPNRGIPIDTGRFLQHRFATSVAHKKQAEAAKRAETPRKFPLFSPIRGSKLPR